MEEKKEKIVHIGLRVPDSIHRRLKAKASLEGKKIADVLWECIQKYLQEEEEKEEAR